MLTRLISIPLYSATSKYAIRDALCPQAALPANMHLQIASRLWHKPFGLFVDATCYGGQNEPQDDLLQKLEAVTPTELSRQLSRVYIYNMNSTFRYVCNLWLKISADTKPR